MTTPLIFLVIKYHQDSPLVWEYSAQRVAEEQQAHCYMVRGGNHEVGVSLLSSSCEILHMWAIAV